MKLLVWETVCLCAVWLMVVNVNGQVVAPVEWDPQGPRPVNQNYLLRGWCRYTFTTTYQSGDFKVNVTFDKQLEIFNDFSSWQRLSSEPGFWYYSQSKWNLNSGQEQRIEFNVEWTIDSGIDTPNAMCVSNGGTASVTTAASTAGTTPAATTTEAPTTTAASMTTTTASSNCGIVVDYGNHKWMQNNMYKARGVCKLSFTEFVPTGDFKVNVSFASMVSSFDDFQTMNLVSSRQGYWYNSQSKWPFNAGQEWPYSFIVSWVNGDFPSGTCYTSTDCNDVTTGPPATTTAAQTTTQAVTTQAPTTTAPVTTTTDAPTTTRAVTTQEVTTTNGPTTTTASVTTTNAPQTTTQSATTPSDSEFPTFNYADVIDLSMDFFLAQRSGALPDNRIPWRGDSALGDKGDNNDDLTGGYYDAGDHVKFNFPMASSMTLLAWGQHVFSDVYEDFGIDARMRETIKWALDYFLKCWKPDSNNPKYYGQVGDGFADHAYWGRPEEMTMARPAFSLTKNQPGSDLAAETASALAAGYLVFRNSDPAYATQLLDAAKSIYAFAESYRGIYSNAISNANTFYRSSGYNDELMLGAVILYEATGDVSYKTRAQSLFPSSVKSAWALSWDDKNVLAQLILYNITGDAQYRSPVNEFLARYRGDVGSDLQFVDGVLAWRSQWAPLRYSANAALVALLAADAGIDEIVNVRWAQSQIDFMLGDNDDGFSYVVGFSDTYPFRPHHRAASCPDLPASCTSAQLDAPGPNPQVINGALVGGPDAGGNFVDDRKDFQRNEVTCDYNAGFTSALAGLAHFRSLLSQST